MPIVAPENEISSDPFIRLYDVSPYGPVCQKTLLLIQTEAEEFKMSMLNTEKHAQDIRLKTRLKFLKSS